MGRDADKGVLYIEGKGWYTRLWIDGRERRFKCATKAQAKALYIRLRAEVLEGRYAPQKYQRNTDLTFSAWLMRCVEASTNRGIQNERRYAKFFRRLWGSRLLKSITTEDCRRLQAKLANKGHLAPATINRKLAYLRRAFSLAVQDGLLDKNPMSGVKLFPEQHRTRYVTPEEAVRLRAHLGPEAWRVVAFAIETGLRRSEQFTLRWNQIDFAAKVLVIPLDKAGGMRYVPLSEAALDILRAQDMTSPYVFASPENPLKPRSPICFVAKHFKPACRKAGLADLKWHDLRHTAASWRAMAGVDLLALKEILGHRDIKTTLRYAHLNRHHLLDAINRESWSDRTVTKTVTSEVIHRGPQGGADMEGLDLTGEKEWLGDQESNLGSQIQSLMSYP